MLCQGTAALPEKPLRQGILPPGEGGDCGISCGRASLDALDLIGHLDRKVGETAAEGASSRVAESEPSIRESRRIPGAGASQQAQGALQGGFAYPVRAVLKREPGRDRPGRTEGEATEPKASFSIRDSHRHQ